MTIAITGTTGNMGSYFLWSLNMSPAAADRIKILCRNKKKAKKILKHYEAISHKLEIVYGGIEDENACRELIKDCDVVFNVCAVIPPKSDSNPQGAIASRIGAVRAVQRHQNFRRVRGLAVKRKKMGGTAPDGNAALQYFQRQRARRLNVPHTRRRAFGVGFSKRQRQAFTPSFKILPR